MHTKNIIFTIFHNRHGIIKILRILAINGDHLPVTDVFSSLHVCLTDRLWYTLCLIQHLLREFYRKIISFYNSHNISSRIIDMTDNLYNPSFRTSAFLAVRSQFNYNFMPVYSFFWLTLWNKNVLKNSLVIRNDKAEITLGLLIGSHHLGHSPGNDTDDLRFLSFASLRRQKCHFHGILMECSTLLVLRNEQILVPSFHFHKSKAFGIADKSSCQHLTVGLHIFPFYGQGKLSFR